MRMHAIAIVVLAAGCAGLPASSRAQADPDCVSAADAEQLSAGYNAFAVDLYRQLAQEPGNLFCAPLSIAQGLALVHVGAAGRTAREIAAVARFPADPRLQRAAQQQLLAAGGSAEPDRESPAGRLRCANGLWSQSGFSLLPSFLRTCRDVYRAPLAEVDFAQQPERARRTINAWVAERTDGRIVDLIGPGDLGRDTRLVLTDAVDFRAAWSQPFPAAATTSGRFQLTADGWVDAAMMQQRGRFACADLPELSVLQLPYRTGDLAFVVLLPKQPDGLAALERDLDADRLQQWLTSLAERELAVILPAFTMTARYDLQTALTALGMGTAFDARADFSGMTADGPLWIDAVIHEARLAVSEEQTVAVAGSAVIMTKGGMIFRADHPFMFLIRDLRGGRILFMGRLVDPRFDNPAAKL